MLSSRRRFLSLETSKILRRKFIHFNPDRTRGGLVEIVDLQTFDRCASAGSFADDLGVGFAELEMLVPIFYLRVSLKVFLKMDAIMRVRGEFMQAIDLQTTEDKFLISIDKDSVDKEFLLDLIEKIRHGIAGSQGGF